MQEIEWRVRHRNLHGLVLCVPLPLTLCGNSRCVTAQRDETRLFTTTIAGGGEGRNRNPSANHTTPTDGLPPPFVRGASTHIPLPIQLMFQAWSEDRLPTCFYGAPVP